MKQRQTIILLVAMFIFAAMAASGQTATQSKLQKEAKVTREQATMTALARVPNGKVKEGELEREKGKLVWSFDIATPGTKGVTEVQVDAMTGTVVSVNKETARAEAREKQAEAREKK